MHIWYIYHNTMCTIFDGGHGHASVTCYEYDLHDSRGIHVNVVDKFSIAAVQWFCDPENEVWITRGKSGSLVTENYPPIKLDY